MLEQPLHFINSNEQNTNGEIAYIIYKDNNIYYSNNIYDLLNINDATKVLNYITNDYGKIKLNGKTYYYNTGKINNATTIALTTDNYVKEQRTTLNKILIPIMSFAVIITILILWLYSQHLVKKISIINKKISNIDNDKYNHNEKFFMNDELNSLLESIEDTKTSLQEKEKQKSSMFQNISHELKTPIMVISSHIEALNDKVISEKQALKVIKEETEHLNQKVSLIMKLNKLNYLENNTSYKNIDIVPIINKAISKFKIIRNDVDFSLETIDNSAFLGNEENWGTVINNILENFTRFAKEKIKITISKDNLKFFNDGKPIKETLLEDIFEPYKVDSNGKHGLGLAIVKQTVILSGYKIKAENLKDGVLFEIYKTEKKQIK